MRILFLQSVPIPRPGVMQLAAVLHQAGYRCRVVVAAEERDPVRAAVRWRPDVLALSCMTGEHREMLSLAGRIRAGVPGLVVVMGGISLLLKNDLIFMWKPTVLNWLFAVICLGSGYFGKKTITYVFG